IHLAHCSSLEDCVHTVAVIVDRGHGIAEDGFDPSAELAEDGLREIGAADAGEAAARRASHQASVGPATPAPLIRILMISHDVKTGSAAPPCTGLAAHAPYGHTKRKEPERSEAAA